MTGWERMRIGVAINLSPFPLGTSSFDAEFDDEHRGGQQADAGELNDSPLLPKGVSADPKGKQADGPKPGIP